MARKRKRRTDSVEPSTSVPPSAIDPNRPEFQPFVELNILTEAEINEALHNPRDIDHHHQHHHQDDSMQPRVLLNRLTEEEIAAHCSSSTSVGPTETKKAPKVEFDQAKD
ncbi:uncharacterized protein LOC116349483 isoform X2 [Contarinia nasturtii]|uniref:uncharacterized protein LOC116349483 isoform X2 n=1 Tax=Contarinia nasturtii TaxID=265458 RepID=UPI0012D492AA|nr:uncharacterized protein LOC116349483 isoform X2 [Contarinia nasturtii]